MKKLLLFLTLLCALPYCVLAQKDNSFTVTYPQKTLVSAATNVYGQRVAMQDNIAVVTSNHGMRQYGISYVYEKQNGVWERVAQLKASHFPDPAKSKGIGQRINITDGHIVISNIFMHYNYVRPEGGWQDMTESSYTEMYSDLSHGHDLYLSNVYSNHNQIAYFITGTEWGGGLSVHSKEGDQWVNTITADLCNFTNPIVEGSQVIAIDSESEDLCCYSDIEDMFIPTPDFKFNYEKDIQGYKADYGQLLVSFLEDDNLFLFKKTGDLFTEDLVPFHLSPSQENHWTATKHLNITENMVSAVYADPDGKLSVLCFERSGDTWSNMNETAIIPLPEGLTLEEGMFTQTDDDLIFSTNGEQSTSAMIYSKTADSWAEGYTTTELSEELELLYGYHNEQFGYSMASSDEYTVVLDKGESLEGNIGRINIFKDKADASLEQVIRLDYKGEHAVTFKSLCYSDNLIAAVVQESSTEEFICLLYDKGEGEWENAYPTKVIRLTEVGGETPWTGIFSIRISGSHLLIKDSNNHIKCFERPAEGWNAISNFKRLEVNYFHDYDVDGDHLAVVHNNYIRIHQYHNNQWEETAAAEINFENEIDTDQELMQGQVLLKDDRLFYGLCYMNYVEDQGNYYPGRILVYTKDGEEWTNHNTPQSIIVNPITDQVLCGYFGEKFEVNDNHLLASFGGWVPEHPISYRRVLSLKLDDNNKPKHYYNVDFDKKEEMKDNQSYGASLSINDDRLLFSYSGDDSMGINTGAVYGKLLSTVDYQPFPVALEELPESNLFHIYPNPVQDQLHIELKDKQTAQISIYDLQGRLMDSFEMEGTSVTYNTSALPKGTYVLKVIAEETVNKVKVVK